MLLPRFYFSRCNIQAHSAFSNAEFIWSEGTGKSELGHCLMSFFVAKNEAPNIENSTIAALASVVEQTANALVHLDEFKNDIDLRKREFLKGLWDGTGRTKMKLLRFHREDISSFGILALLITAVVTLANFGL